MFFAVCKNLLQFMERSGITLPGMGGVFNTVNLHVYHYAGNNPIKYLDPDGRIAWTSTMWWIAVADGLFPVGDAIYGVGVAIELAGLYFLARDANKSIVASKAKENTSKGSCAIVIQIQANIKGRSRETIATSGPVIGNKAKSAWDNIFGSESTNDKLRGKPGEIKKKGKQETKMWEDGKAVRERHNTDHGNPKAHTNPHDYDIIWDSDGNPIYSKPINYPDDVPEFK